MTYLLDASAGVDLLVRSDTGERVREALSAGTPADLASVAHLDAEVFSGLARLHRAGELSASEVDELLFRLASLPMQRLPVTGELLAAAWTLRENVAARDGLYVAAARALGARLLTTDQRLSRAVPDLVVALP